MIQFRTRQSALEWTTHALSHFFTRSLYIAFIAAGIASAAVSAFAEFEVVHAFYPKHAVISGGVFAFLVVAVLEISKLFLVFFNRQYSSIGDAKYTPVRWIFAGIRWSLVTISVFCMMLYTLYSLSNPEYEKQTSTVEASLRADHQRVVSRIDSSFQSRKAQQYAQDSVSVLMWREKMLFETNNVVGRTWRGQNFTTYEAMLDTAQRVQTANQATLDKERLSEIAQADSALGLDISSMKAQLKTSSVSQNQMLAQALQLVTGSTEYSYAIYTICVIIISLLLSITLESTMWAVLTAMAVTYGDAFTASLRAGTRSDEYSAVGRTKSRMNREDTRQFHDQVRHEKEEIIRTVQDDIDALQSNPL